MGATQDFVFKRKTFWMLNLRWEMMHRGSLVSGIKKKTQIIFPGQLAVLKHNCRNTLEHGGERCVNIDKGDSPVSWRKAYGWEVLCLHVHTSSAIRFQPFPEQHWPSLQEWWEIAFRNLHKSFLLGWSQQMCSAQCSMVWWLLLGKCRKILSQPKFGVKLNSECVSRYPYS